jgi:hypothetical protein
MSGQVSQIREHMEVIGSDGQHVGTVDKVEGNRIKLTKRDDPDGSGQHHHYLDTGMVAAVQGNQVKLTMDSAKARQAAQATGGAESSPGTAG